MRMSANMPEKVAMTLGENGDCQPYAVRQGRDMGQSPYCGGAEAGADGGAHIARTQRGYGLLRCRFGFTPGLTPPPRRGVAVERN